MHANAAQFVLTTGHGVAVCEAYLKVLNEAKFESQLGGAVSPFCGRPDDGPREEGFLQLQRHYLTADEIFSLSMAVHDFMWYDDGAIKFKPVEFESLADVQLSLVSRSLRVWTYSDPVDMGNDGSPRAVLIWQGYGALAGRAICGVPGGSPHPVWDDLYTQQRAFVLSADGRSIDVERTHAIFGAYDSHVATDAGKGRVLEGGHNSQPGNGVKPFQPLSDSIGIFGFQGRYYVQTENKPANRTAKLPSVEVLLHEGGHTGQVCASGQSPFQRWNTRSLTHAMKLLATAMSTSNPIPTLRARLELRNSIGSFLPA